MNVPVPMSVGGGPVSYTHLRAHETVLDIVCRLLLAKNKHSLIKTFKIYTTTNLLISYYAFNLSRDAIYAQY